jgi:hypothetical protein
VRHPAARQACETSNINLNCCVRVTAFRTASS